MGLISPENHWGKLSPAEGLGEPLLFLSVLSLRRVWSPLVFEPGCFSILCWGKASPFTTSFLPAWLMAAWFLVCTGCLRFHRFLAIFAVVQLLTGVWHFCPHQVGKVSELCTAGSECSPSKGWCQHLSWCPADLSLSSAQTDSGSACSFSHLIWTVIKSQGCSLLCDFHLKMKIGY